MLTRDTAVRNADFAALALFVLPLQTFSLLRRNSTSQKLPADLMLALAVPATFQSILEHRFIAQLSVNGCLTHAQKHQQRNEPQEPAERRSSDNRSFHPISCLHNHIVKIFYRRLS